MREIYIFIKKCIYSFIEVRKLCLIMFPLVFVLQLYNNNTTEAIKNICWAKGKRAVDQNNQMAQKFFCLGCKNLNYQAWSSKNVDSLAIFQAIETNPVSSALRVSGELGISQSSGVCYPHNFGKSIQSCQVVLYITKILQNFWLIQELKPLKNLMQIQSIIFKLIRFIIFIIKGFRTIVFIFIVISTMFRRICPPTFELHPLLNLRGLPVLIPLAITRYKY